MIRIGISSYEITHTHTHTHTHGIKFVKLTCVRLTITLPILEVRFVAFPETEYDEVLSGYQPGQMVER
jgi:hypothetical protein